MIHGGTSLRRRDGEAVVSVTDPGLGMPAEDLRRLFQLFSRLPTGREIEGTGLGLYIARGIVEAHGGRIWAESAGPGQGSTFGFGLPLHPRAQPRSPPEALWYRPGSERHLST